MSDKENKDDDLKFSPQDDGSAIVETGVEDDKNTASDEDTGEDRRLSESAEDADEDGHEDETHDEAEARRERNRQRRAQNKESRKNYIESLKRDLAARDQIINDLSSRVASVEQHSVGNQLAQIDNAIKEAADYYNHFKAVARQAVEQANGDAAVDAQEKMFAAQQRYNSLQAAKRNMSAQAQQPKPLDPRMKQNAEEWIARNPWYDASGSDADSNMVISIDTRLVQEGWNPTTKEYWDELDARVKKYLPHRTVSGYNKPQGTQRPRVPVAGSGQEAASSVSKGQYRLSAERVQALKDAGVYDDPKKRADAIRRFQEYDRRQAGKN